MKQKQEGKILGLPEEKHDEVNNIPEEPSFYFYEEDEEELENLVELVYPILEMLEFQIWKFNSYNRMS